MVCAVLVLCAACTTRGKGPASSSRASLEIADAEQSVKAEVRAMLDADQFDRLDALSDELNRTKARFPGGDWKSYRFQQALKAPIGGADASDLEWNLLIARLKRWRDSRPDSIAAAVALTDAATGFGWKARGTGFNRSVTPEGRRLLSARMALADGVLVDVARRVSPTPEWYRAMINSGRVRGWDRRQVTDLFERAEALEPRYLHVYDVMAEYLMPRWFGKDGDWERFAESSAERLGGREGSVVYSDIAWQMSIDGEPLFAENRASWPLVKQGFIDREALYGASLRNLNAFCELAGSAGDRETTRELLLRIGEQWDPETWKERKYFDGYWKWAFEEDTSRYHRISD
jgi:hypothetical protein